MRSFFFWHFSYVCFSAFWPPRVSGWSCCCWPNKNGIFRFSLATFCVPWVQHIDHGVTRNGFVCICPVWCLLNFWSLHIHVLTKFGEFLRHFLSIVFCGILSFFPLGTLVLYVGPFEIVPRGPTRLFILFCPSSFFWLGDFLKFTDSILCHLHCAIKPI